MLLARTAQNTITLGSVESAASIGMVLGGIGMSAWGGFQEACARCAAGMDLLKPGRQYPIRAWEGAARLGAGCLPGRPVRTIG